MDTALYIPINTDSLAHYFSRAIILPSCFYKNKKEDIQNRISDSILLSINKWIKNCDCSIEVIFTSEELKKLKILDSNFLSFDKSIPVSRIKKVYFTDKKQMETTIWNINNGAGFVPEQILSIENVKEEDFHSDFFNFEIEKSSISDELEKKVSRFDTALGGFAFMKVGTSDFSEYPLNYFSTLAHFNKLISEQVELAKKSKGFNFSERYKGLFISNDNEWSKWQPYIYKNVEVGEIESIAEKEGIRIEKKLGVVNLNSINPNSYIYDLAVLAIYGNGKNKSTDDLISSIQMGVIPNEKREEIALLFGLNSGYTKLHNQYKSNNKTFNVKFKLDSQLDYYIIESVYQFIFNNRKDNYTFEYIDSFCIKQKPKTRLKGFNSYIILDKLIVAKKKASLSEEYWSLYSDSICEPISNFSKKYIPPFANFDKDASIEYFKELLQNNVISSISKFEQNILEENEDDFKEEIFNLKSDYEKRIEDLQNEIKSLKSKDEISIEKETKEVDNKDLQKENNQSLLTTVDYNKFNLSELKAIGKLLGISGLSKYKKENIEELVLLIKNNKTIL